MKRLLFIIVATLFSLNTFACIHAGGDSKLAICTGSIVYPDKYNHGLGARVKAVDVRTKSLLVSSLLTGEVSRLSTEELSLAVGCIEEVCIGDTVYSDGERNSLGSKVIAINFYTSRVTLVSKYTKRVTRYGVDQIATTRFCIDDLCAGDRVYPDVDTHVSAARVLATNVRNGKVTFASDESKGVLGRLLPENISRRNGCIDGVCTKDYVYLKRDYEAHGAIVLAVNPYTGLITIVSKVNKVIYRVTSSDLFVVDECLDYGPEQRSLRSYLAE